MVAKGHNYGKCKKCSKIHINGMIGHNWGLCMKCGKYHKHKSNKGKHFKRTGQALKNLQEANRIPEKIRKFKQTIKRKFKNGYVGPTFRKHWKMSEQALKNNQEANRRPERKMKRKQTWEKKIANGFVRQDNGKKRIGQALKNLQEANIKKWQNPKYRKKQLEAIRKFQYPNLIYNYIHFRSPGEIIWYKLFEKLNIPFGYEVLYTDFTFYKNGIPVLCMEHHPSSRWYQATLKNQKAYYKERRKILDDNGLNDVPLIVTTSLDEKSKSKIKKLLKKLCIVENIIKHQEKLKEKYLFLKEKPILS